RPAFELKGFQKLRLAAGESRRISIPLDRYAFRVFDPVARRWAEIGGDYEVSVGHDAADRPLKTVVAVAGEEGRPSRGVQAPRRRGAAVAGEAAADALEGRSAAASRQSGAAAAAAVSPAAAALPHYAAADPRGVTDEEFAALLGRPLPPSPAGGPLGRTSPLSDLEHAPGWIGRAIHQHYFRRKLARAAAKGEVDLDLLFQHSMLFRTIANMSGGLADMKLVDGLLALVNGRFLAGVGGLVKGFAAGRVRERAWRKRFEHAARGPDGG
ncbi:MAG: fibronectin type III-like domain-contianing protein, partial [Propionibacteriaceae bacterium]|nr:fibronectin type III-like domain-contianing protein [Propionibacteriaceae bacterium]